MIFKLSRPSGGQGWEVGKHLWSPGLVPRTLSDTTQTHTPHHKGCWQQWVLLPPGCGQPELEKQAWRRDFCKEQLGPKWLHSCTTYRAWHTYAVTKVFCNFGLSSVERFFPPERFPHHFNHILLYLFEAERSLQEIHFQPWCYISLKRRGLSKKFIFNPGAISL